MNAPHPSGVVDINIEGLCDSASELAHALELPSRRLTRSVTSNGGTRVIVDRFHNDGASCLFLRISAGVAEKITLGLSGQYDVQRCSAGGWLVASDNADLSVYWIPRLPAIRTLDSDGHIQSTATCDVLSLSVNAHALCSEFTLPHHGCLDFVIWRLDSAKRPVTSELQGLSTIERQPAFLWSSHTRYTRPADIYGHLVFGHVYENHEVWPKYWRVCSELDAQALYVTLNGLARLTGKTLYRLLKEQLVLSVIDRQREDGGWYHGEWTELMESHFRLHSGGIHLLAAAYQEKPDDRIREALDKATAFVSRRAQRIDAGVWFMHDSLEADTESIRHYPFRWASSRALGKAPNNMMILNTHLDTIVALDRYREATADDRYASQVASARQAAEAVFAQRPAETLYRALFSILDLTFLPKSEAVKLPLIMRALKRIGWKYLAPNLHRIKSVWPRLVMPNGFIDRSIAQAGLAVRYQSVHVWDLVRLLRRFPSEPGTEALLRALAYTQSGSRIREHWKEDPSRRDALGFWQEALYYLCVSKPDVELVGWLGETVIDSEDVGVGIAPSLLGGNAEAVSVAQPLRLHAPDDPRLRFVDLSNGEHAGFLIVNPTSDAIAVQSEESWSPNLSWHSSSLAARGADLVVPGRGWLWAREIVG